MNVQGECYGGDEDTAADGDDPLSKGGQQEHGGLRTQAKDSKKQPTQPCKRNGLFSHTKRSIQMYSNKVTALVSILLVFMNS